jgi:hypothetical protein
MTMSFNKDNSNLPNVAPFGGELGARERALRNNRRARQEGGGRAFWSLGLKLPRDHTRWLRLIPGDHVIQATIDDNEVFETRAQYITIIEHFHGGLERSGLCSAGVLHKNKNKREPCHGCDLFWEDVQANRGLPDSQKKRRISKTEKKVFTVWDYGLWANITRTAGDNKEYKDWTPLPPNDARATQYESKYGHLVPLPLSMNFFWALYDYSKNTVKKDCRTCGSVGTVRCVVKVCAACNNVIYDPNTSALTKEQQERLEAAPCARCGYQSPSGECAEVVECSCCSPHGYQAERATLFDVDLELGISGSKEQPILMVTNRSGPRPIQVQDPKVLEGIKPLPLEKMYAPTPLEKQREIWKIPGTQAAPEPAQPFVPQGQYQPPQPPPQMMGVMGAPQGFPSAGIPQQQPPMPTQPQAQPQTQPQLRTPVGLPSVPGFPPRQQ